MANRPGGRWGAGFFERYVDRDANNLLARVDFLGIIADGLKGVLVLFVSVLAGSQLAINRAVSQMFNTAFNGLKTVVNTVLSAPQVTIQTAVDTAGQRIEVFGLGALPAGVVIAVASVTGVSVIIYLFTGVD